jgi:hypothetical protein
MSSRGKSPEEIMSDLEMVSDKVLEERKNAYE